MRDCLKFDIQLRYTNFCEFVYTIFFVYTNSIYTNFGEYFSFIFNSCDIQKITFTKRIITLILLTSLSLNIRLKENALEK